MVESILFFILGCGCLWGSRNILCLINKVKHWPSVKGKLLEKHIGDPIRVPQDTLDDKQIFVKYTYKVNETEYSGENVYSIELKKGVRTMLSRMAKKKMQKIQNEPLVFYNPNNPQESFLFADSIWWGRLLLILGFLFLFISIVEFLYL